MKRLGILTIVMLVALTGVAFADVQFNFTYNDPMYSLQGVLTASPNGGGVFTATGVTGTLTYLSNTYPLLLVPVGTVAVAAGGADLFGQDNLLYPNDPGQLLTSDAILFMVPTPTPVVGYNGGTAVALWGNGGSNYSSWTFSGLGGYGAGTNNGSFTLTAVPEPGAVSLLIAMALGVGVSLGVFRKIAA